MIILTDSYTFLLEKTAKKRGITISGIYKFPDDLENIEFINSSEDLLVIFSEIFYKVLITSNVRQDVFKSFDEILRSVYDLIYELSSKPINIYIPLIPSHFLYESFTNESYYNSDSIELYMNYINSSLFKNLSQKSNIIFLKGLEKINVNTAKDYFRFSSIYDLKNSELIWTQYLSAHENINIKKKKLIVIDLDNTLWKGEIGEVSIKGIRLDLSDPIGSVFNHVQRIFLDFKKRGFLLAICSKNEEHIALNALFNHPSSLISKEDIVAHRINWKEKSKNILEICEELNISPKDTIFVDDSKHECEEVLSNIDQISIFTVPENIFSYPSLLLNDPLFLYDSSTAEDSNRTSLYKEGLERKKFLETTLKQLGSKEEWLRSLKTKLEISKITTQSGQMQRIIQLFNRTNQFNMTGNRYSTSSLASLLNNPRRIYYYGSSSDRVGSEGIISVLGLFLDDNKIFVEDFILSCRVFNRSIEESMLKPLIEFAIKNSYSIIFKFKDTGRNKVACDFLTNNFINNEIKSNEELNKIFNNINTNSVNINYDLKKIFQDLKYL